MAYNNNTDLGEEIRFDQELTAEVSDEYEPLPEGEYNFTAVYKNQSRFNGSAKLGPCNQMNVDIHLEGRTIPHRFYMNTKAVKWAFGLNAFFIALGLAQPGQTFRPDWNALPGRTGRCKLGIRKWTGDDGKEHFTNEIKAFLAPAQQSAPAPQQQSYQASAQQSAPQQTYQPQQQTMGGWNSGKF
jgi:hypothetical protein